MTKLAAGLPKGNSADRIKRDCTCPRARHQHGEWLAYLSDRCRCIPCTTAWVERDRARKKILARKRWGHADPRAHAPVPAAPTMLRLRALAVLGYGTPEISARFGGTPGELRDVRLGRYSSVQQLTAARIEAAFRQLWLTPSRNPKAGQIRSRAIKHGWLSPLGWDDDSVEGMSSAVSMATTPGDFIDEIAVTEAIRGRKVTLTKAEVSQAIETMNRMGYSSAEIAERVGLSQRDVVRKRSKVAA